MIKNRENKYDFDKRNIIFRGGSEGKQSWRADEKKIRILFAAVFATIILANQNLILTPPDFWLF